VTVELEIYGIQMRNSHADTSLLFVQAHPSYNESVI